MNWEQCARTAAWFSGLSILQTLLSEQSQRQNQCPCRCLLWPGTPDIPGCWRQPEQFRCLFMRLPFLVKEMTSDSFSVTKSPPELQEFTEIAVRISPNAWRVKAGDGVAAVPAGLPSNIHHNIRVGAQRQTLMEGREGAKFTALFLQVFWSRNSWVYFCILRFWVCGKASRDGDTSRWRLLVPAEPELKDLAWQGDKDTEGMCGPARCVKAGRGAA